MEMSETLLRSVLGTGKRGPVVGFDDGKFVLVVRTLPGKYVNLVEDSSWDGFVSQVGEYAKEYEVALVDEDDTSEPVDLPDSTFPKEPIRGDEDIGIEEEDVDVEDEPDTDVDDVDEESEDEDEGWVSPIFKDLS